MKVIAVLVRRDWEMFFTKDEISKIGDGKRYFVQYLRH
jgi:hypothetical protein